MSFGVFFGQLLTYVLKKITGDDSGMDFWRITYGFTLITQMIQLLSIIFIYPYETPKYLMMERRPEECKDLLCILYKSEYVQEIFAQKEDDLRITVNRESEMQQNTSKKTIPITLALSIILQVFQQFSGVNALNLYANEIFGSIFENQLALIAPLFINFTVFVSGILSFPIINKFGRKTIILVGFLLACAADIIIAVGLGQ